MEIFILQQLSQFWYEETTSRKLAEEVLAQAGPNGRVACVSCPSIFRACQVSENGEILINFKTNLF